MDRNLNLDKLLSEYMARRHLKAPTLAKLVTERGFPLHRSSVRNWLNGDARKTRDWRPIVAMAEVLYLNQEETDLLLQAAGHLPVAELWKERARDKQDHKLLSRWAEGLRKKHKLAPFHAPRDLSHFVGRKAELEVLKEELLAGRHVTLIGLEGMAGVGKTALAIHVAHQLHSHFPDGVLWAQLNTSDTMSVLSVWAEAYGRDVSKYTDVESRSQIVRELLASKRALIVLDNAQSSEEIELLLPPTGTSPVIITTRHRYLSALRGARRFIVGPFDEQKGEAFDLFVKILGKERVQAERAALAEIAKLLEYLPMAVDIAASRLAYEPNWTASQLLERLRPEKQRLSELQFENDSVQASFNLSYDALPIELQQFFAMLGVFGGGDFSVEAVAHIAEMSLNEAEDNLRKLYGISLVQEGRQGRYRFHPLLRDYAKQKLTDEKAVYERMVEFFTHYVESHERDYEALDLENDNILAAFQVASGHGMQTALVRGANAFYRFLDVRGLYEQAQVHATLAQQAARSLGDQVGLITALGNLGAIAERYGDYAKAEEYFQQGLALAREIGHRERFSGLLGNLGALARKSGDDVHAEEYLQEGLALAREVGDRERIHGMLENLGTLAFHHGTYKQAEEYWLEGLALAREIGDREGINNMLTDLGTVAARQGNNVQAEEYWLESLALMREIGHRERISHLLQDLGGVAFNRGDNTQAEQYLLEGLALAREIGHRERMSFLLTNLGAVEYSYKNYKQAEEYWLEGLALAREIGHGESICYLLANLAEVLGERGDYLQAEEYLQEGLALARKMGNRWLISGILCGWGELHLRQGNPDAVTAALNESLGVARDIGAQDLAAIALYGLARAAAARGNPLEARRQGRESLAIFEAIDHHKAAEVEEWLAQQPGADQSD